MIRLYIVGTAMITPARWRFDLLEHRLRGSNRRRSSIGDPNANAAPNPIIPYR